MASRPLHDVAGAVVGGGAALYRARNQKPNDQVVEAIGGVIGGIVGSRIPDWIEPAIMPCHRTTFHSVTIGIGGNTMLHAKSGELTDWLRAEAVKRGSAAGAETDPLSRFIQQMLEFLLRLAAGAVAGVTAGYISHLALDATTPMSIPLVTRGF